VQAVIAVVVLAFIASLNLWATWKVLQDRSSTRGQQAAQAANFSSRRKKAGTGKGQLSSTLSVQGQELPAELSK
jgi:hypothetical protein